MRFGEREAGPTLRREYRPSGALLHKRGYVDYRPYGVAVIIAPWNYPFVLVVGPVGSSPPPQPRGRRSEPTMRSERRFIREPPGGESK